MSEIWLPGDTPMPDATNIFDMAIMLQRDLEDIDDFAEFIQFQNIAVYGLRAHIEQNSEMYQEFSVKSEIALLEDSQNTPVACMENMRFYGIVSDAGILSQKEYKLGIAIRLDAFTYSTQEPQAVHNSIFQPVSVPVAKIQQVELVS